VDSGRNEDLSGRFSKMQLFGALMRFLSRGWSFVVRFLGPVVLKNWVNYLLINIYTLQSMVPGLSKNNKLQS
jgi:hypothetical protein